MLFRGQILPIKMLTNLLLMFPLLVKQDVAWHIGEIKDYPNVKKINSTEEHLQ